jgi:hypothetical protein
MNRSDFALPLVWLALSLILAGFVLNRLGIQEANAAAGVGLLLFVLAAWLAARPRPSRRANATALFPPPPYGPDSGLIEFGDRLRQEAEEARSRSNPGR